MLVFGENFVMLGSIRRQFALAFSSLHGPAEQCTLCPCPVKETQVRLDFAQQRGQQKRYVKGCSTMFRKFRVSERSLTLYLAVDRTRGSSAGQPGNPISQPNCPPTLWTGGVFVRDWRLPRRGSPTGRFCLTLTSPPT